MEREIIRRHFESMGARVRFRNHWVDDWGRPHPGPGEFTLDVARDRRGSIFDVLVGKEAPELFVLQVRPRERHLLLMSRDGHRFLCGHDERDWFVAAVPSRVSTVRDAKLALMPPAVHEKALRRSPSATLRRRNKIFTRQGEWFFVPVDRDFPEELILRNEPLQRTPRSKPHVCEELYREGGEVVYLVSGRAYSEDEYREMRRRHIWFGRRGVVRRLRNPEVYVRGCVRHPDHSTVHLKGWHRVHINGEIQEHTRVSFLD